MTFKLTKCSGLLVFTFFLAKIVFASDGELSFDKIKVPGAECGDGSDYSLYLRKGDPDKLLLHFQGGGACWNYSTCYGLTPYTRLRDEGISGSDTVFNEQNLGKHPFKNYTYVFIPYCTGDIFVGDHEAKYAWKTVEHRGKSNTKKLLNYIEDKFSHLVSNARKLVVYGESAGALGALFNMDLIKKLPLKAEDKTLIVDSPGLHFSSAIWNRFSDDYIGDIEDSLQSNGMELDTSTGVLAKQMLNYCHHNSDWKMGVIQATKDLIMSIIFGLRTEAGHRAQVLGPDGIDQTLGNKHDPCSSWVPESSKHVWALKKDRWRAQTNDGTVLEDYVNNLLASDISDDFLSHK